MKKVTIILGPHNSGKTTLAKKIAEGRKAIFTNSMKHGSWHSDDLTQETEILVIEECFPIDQVFNLISCDHLIINKQGYPIREVSSPDLVLTSNCFTAKDFKSLRFRQNVQIIELKPLAKKSRKV